MEQVLDNFYTKDEIDRIWQEIKYLDSNTYGWSYPNKTMNAVNDTGDVLLQGARQFGLSAIFDDYQHIPITIKSNIYTLGKKIVKWQNYLKNKHDVYLNIENVDNHTTFINYFFKDDGVYKLHHDNSIYTMLSYFYEEPRNFTGGNFVVEDREYEIFNGFTIILPGWLKHGTTPVKMIDKSRAKSGRYSVAHFFNIASGTKNGIYSKVDYEMSNIKKTYDLFDPTPIKE